MGMTESEFWHMNPRRYHIRVVAFEKRQKALDREQWQQGYYFYIGTLSALDHAFNGRNAQFDYPEQPLSEKNESQFFDASELPEEEKQKLREQLVKKLKGMEKAHNDFVKDKNGGK